MSELNKSFHDRTSLINIDLDLLNGTENYVNAVTNLILTNSKSLVASIYHKKNKRKIISVFQSM